MQTTHADGSELEPKPDDSSAPATAYDRDTRVAVPGRTGRIVFLKDIAYRT